MFFDFAELDPTNVYKLMTSTITPRPIAWVVSQSAEGQLNAAPFSFFNAMSGDPPIIALGIGNRDSGQPKDSFRNITQTGQFVVNLVCHSMVGPMNITAIEFGPEVNEVEMARLETLPSTKVKPPRLKDAPVAFECEFFQSVDIGNQRAVILGRLLAVHIGDEFVTDPVRCHIDTPALQLIGRMHGAGWYARTTDLFKLDRIPLAEWKT